jgi:GalNAc5-diNAcBac-PP-undecaprenol beta-1,3-glucosyltransferase
LEDRCVEISIIMATFNRAHFILEALRSIQNQSFVDWECRIIDDGSVDDTAGTVTKLALEDPRFIYSKRLSGYKKGLPGCRNQGIDQAKGNYIIFFDDDDIVHPENLSTCIKKLKATDFKFCRYNKRPFIKKRQVVFHENKNPLTEIFHTDHIGQMVNGGIPFASCCVLWKKECFSDEKFNENLMYAEEWECYSRILSNGIQGISIDSILYYNRKHARSNTGEFQRNDLRRRQSQVEAGVLVIENLRSKNLFNEKLKKFFLRMGIELKSYELVKQALEASGAKSYEKLQYKIGYKIYPLLKPIFYLKGKL